MAKLQATQELSNNCKLREIKYLNNVVEQDHRFVKRMCRHKQWFRNFSAVSNTLAGFEAMHMIKKGQVKRVAKYYIIAQNNYCNKTHNYCPSFLYISHYNMKIRVAKSMRAA